MVLLSLCRNADLSSTMSRLRHFEIRRFLSYSSVRKPVTETKENAGHQKSASLERTLEIKRMHDATTCLNDKAQSSLNISKNIGPLKSARHNLAASALIENSRHASKDTVVSVTSVVDDDDSGIHTESVSDMMWQKVGKSDKSFGDFVKEVYLPLSKVRLTMLVVCTAMEGYGMAPVTFPFDPIAFSALLVGTSLTSACANSVNQIMETPYDAQMNRTKNRPLIRGKLTPLHAATFALISGTTGVAVLLAGTNPLTAALGLSNILLYTCVYTPMKRLSVANTWVGSVVGAIPPMMGWAACTGGLEPGAWILGAILYCWQFPHFNALSWNLRADYSRAGYRMASVIDPGMCRRVCVRHSIAMIPLSILAASLDVTSWWFVVDSMPFNLYLIYLSYKFYQEGSSRTSKQLFRFSLFHIPAILLLMIISKNRIVATEESGSEEGLV